MMEKGNLPIHLPIMAKEIMCKEDLIKEGFKKGENNKDIYYKSEGGKLMVYFKKENYYERLNRADMLKR